MSLLSLATILLVALSTIPDEGFAMKPFHNFQEENGLLPANQMMVEAIAGGAEANLQTRQKRAAAVEKFEAIGKGLEQIKDGIELVRSNIQDLDPSDVPEVIEYIMKHVTWDDIVQGGLDVGNLVVKYIEDHANPKEVIETIAEATTHVSLIQKLAEKVISLYDYIVN